MFTTQSWITPGFNQIDNWQEGGWKEKGRKFWAPNLLPNKREMLTDHWSVTKAHVGFLSNRFFVFLTLRSSAVQSETLEKHNASLRLLFRLLFTAPQLPALLWTYLSVASSLFSIIPVITSIVTHWPLLPWREEEEAFMIIWHLEAP